MAGRDRIRWNDTEQAVVALRFVFVTAIVSGQQAVEMVDYLCKSLMIPYWYEYVDVGISP
jgi:uncharacterized membrane protein YwzB